ncbi:hypothetical protein GCM10011352_05210 [Marinobacterium zhoushanense]|uniref:Protein kinase domain-containing protein n=1 Tax=Marinobacterium zhoushanense TaxID=1679163 RepID=A0ABQ1K1U5_9GAMM|nr:phosphotransferase [Marinobacterium zhoushanense]GGB82354.1 hypothetical protein GCM10011352_05210 [Marinobacterium zhoushanense]
MAIGENLWRQQHRVTGLWHRFKGASDDRRRYFLLNEERWLSRLQGLPLARCHALRDCGDGMLLVTDYLPGETLAALIRQQGGRFSGHQQVLVQLFEALVQLHRQGAVHGDLKPGNLLFDGDTLYLLDLASTACCGVEIASLPYRSFSPSYSLPCQQQGFGVIDPLMDWYAYLIILRLLLGGDLARPDWSSAGPASHCFTEWVAGSGLPRAMRQQLIDSTRQLDRLLTATRSTR